MQGRFRPSRKPKPHMLAGPLWCILGKTMTDFDKLLKTLNDYCELQIFSNSEYLNFAHFQWLANSIIISVGNKTYKTHEEALSNNLGVHFGFNFTLNPWSGEERYTEIIGQLDKYQFRDHYRSKILIRKLFISNDNIKIDRAISELYSEFGEVASNVLGWLKMSSGHLPSSSFLNLSLPEEKIPEDIRIDRIWDRKSITKDDIFIRGLGPGDLLQLFLYSGDIHIDFNKRELFEIYQDHYGNFLESILDMYSVILFKLSKHLLIPMINGHQRK
jgi:hypothetical protein